MTHVTCRLTAKNRVSSGTLRSVIEYRLPLPFTYEITGVHGYLPSHNHTTFVPATQRTMGDRTFAIAGPRAWNSLPDSPISSHLQTFIANLSLLLCPMFLLTLFLLLLVRASLTL